jgi:hypothetical protein
VNRDDPRPAAALALARRGVAVFPLAGKVPLIRGGRGVLDATTDLDVVREWWRMAPGANIGARVPDDRIVVDVDPRNGGHVGLAQLVTAHGPLPTTLTTWSGRGDGGRHLWWLRPPGRLTSRQLPDGIDLKTSTGYVVVPPSLHPATGQPYRWEKREIVAPPQWLTRLLLDERPSAEPRSGGWRDRVRIPGGRSVVEDFNAATSWHDVLDPHGWRCNGGDGDGSSWRHPDATAPSSASVRGGRLYVYSPNTPFDPTEPGAPRGYSRFEAWAVLNHDGDQRAAARHFRTTGAIA